MDDAVLVDNMEAGEPAMLEVRVASVNRNRPQSSDLHRVDDAPSSVHLQPVANVIGGARKKRNGRPVPSTTIEMRPPESRATTSHGRLSSTTSAIYSYGDSVIADNIKCVVSTMLFLAVVVAIIVVALLKNPGM